MIAMCYTNFAFDAPLTIKLTNKFKNFANYINTKKQEKAKAEVTNG
jgi:hypothetical protein